MIAWLVGNRLLGLALDAPEGPTTAFIGALALATYGPSDASAAICGVQ